MIDVENACDRPRTPATAASTSLVERNRICRLYFFPTSRWKDHDEPFSSWL